VNHFLLWVGPAYESSATNKSLLSHYKSVEELTTAAGRNWFLSSAAQQDGLGAFHDNRKRVFASKQLFWFGHAWSQTDGAQPAFSLLKSNADNSSNIKLVELVREKSDGVFAFALIDEASEELIIAADANGSFHIYYRELPGGIAISNSSALLAGLPPRASLDPMGLQELCSNSVANEDRSIWSSVRKLRSNQILKINLGNPRIELIGHRPLLAALDDIQDYTAQPATGLFDSISSVLLMLDREGGRGSEFRGAPWAADLTGGNDSRALMAAIVANHIHVASTVSGPLSDPDVQIGERLARKLGLAHFTRPPLGPITPAQFFDTLQLTDGEFDAIEYSSVAAVHRMHIRDGLQFSVNGTYGELARGHAFRLGLPGMLFPDRMASTLKRREPLTLSHPSIDRWNQLCSLKNPANLFSEEAQATCSNYFNGIFGRLMAYAGHLPQHAQLDLIHADLRIERWLGRLQSCTNQLWPAITPWGFQEPLTRIMTANPTDRRNGLLTRTFTYRYSPALAGEPLYTGNPAMPFSLRHVHKFLPVVPYFADRAWQKVSAKFHFGSTEQAPSASERQPLLCADEEIKRWLTEPLLADTGLFDTDVLLRLMSPVQPQSARMHQLWGRLLTVEAALRLQASAGVPAWHAGA
jgi:hypothetical protein